MAPTKKRTPNAVSVNTEHAASPDAALSAGPSSTSLSTDPPPTVRVNTANLSEIKAALDEIVKKYLSDQSFTPSNLNPSIHLGLGYSSVLLSVGGMLYSLKVPFEESKPVLWASVVGYFVLQTVLWAWKRWFEKGEVFRGKRRRVIKRIETDHVQVTTSTSLNAPPPPQVTFSPHTRPGTPSQPSSPRSISSMELSPSSSSSASALKRTATSAALPSAKSARDVPSGASSGPTYLVHLELSTTSNNGKSLIHKSRVVSGKGVGEFVDEDGGVEDGEVRRWLAGILSDAGLAGAEEEGLKAE